jgi:predicted MFS family arabinose efflux permease
MRIQRNLRLIDIYTIGMNMILIVPVLLPYYRDQIGIGFREFLISESCFAAVIIMGDVPTGWISDVWQRKHAFGLGILFLIMGYSCLLIARSFAMVIATQMILGVGISLCNGTNTAILYDSLLSVGREAEYRKREGRRQALCMYTIAASSIVGSIIYTQFHHLPLIVGIMGLLAALVAVCALDEPERHKIASARHPLRDIIAATKYALHDHVEIAFIIFAAGAFFATTKLMMWSQQPYYMVLKVPEAWYGTLMAVGFMLSGLSSHLSHLLDGRITAPRALAIIWLMAIIVCLGSSIGPGWHGIALLMFGGSCLYGIAMPRVNQVINSNVDSSRRATVLSTLSTMGSVYFIPLSMIMSVVSKHWGIQAVLVALAIWLAVAGVVLSVMAAARKKSAPLKEVQI